MSMQEMMKNISKLWQSYPKANVKERILQGSQKFSNLLWRQSPLYNHIKL